MRWALRCLFAIRYWGFNYRLMAGLQGERLTLRGVEERDIEVMYQFENDLDNWAVSGTTVPFSRYLLSRFVEAQGVDIFERGDLRLMVELNGGGVVGAVDLFEVDGYNHRAGVGILIVASERGKGYGAEALRLVEGYSRDFLQLHQLWCGVDGGNAASLSLFGSLGYREVGRRREWLWRADGYCDQIEFQKIL